SGWNRSVTLARRLLRGRCGFDREPIDLAELRLEVPDVRAGVHPAACDPLQHLLRRVLPPVAVPVPAEPPRQLAELALLELRVQVGQLATRLVPELHGDHVPERVRREVSERS